MTKEEFIAEVNKLKADAFWRLRMTVVAGGFVSAGYITIDDIEKYILSLSNSITKWVAKHESEVPD